MAQAFRNLTRAILFEKALVKFSKKNGNLSETSAYILYVFNLQGKASFHLVSQIGKTLAHVDRKIDQGKLYRLCAELYEKGYLIRADEDTIRYKLSMAGSNLLTELEKLARNERWDR